MSSVELIAPSTEFRRTRRHVESHRPTPQQCNVVNGTSKRLEWHRKSVHSTVVKCPFCGKTFKSKTAMTMHQNENEFKKTQNFKIHGAMKGMGKYS